MDARHHGGRWLLRMEDLDSARVLPGCADRMLRTLERFGLCWDGEVIWQSRRIERYRTAASALRARGLTFQCSCSRRELPGVGSKGYPGTCRAGAVGAGPFATRLRVDDQQVMGFGDRVQGRCRFALGSLGDFVILRKDGIPAYQLAVVVDDADQGITDVVRGADLLESTAWQLTLQRALSLPRPRYAHLPLVVEPGAAKLSKSRRSLAIEPAAASAQLSAALRLLNHAPPDDVQRDAPARVLEWAIRNWNPRAFHGLRSICAPRSA